jgi:hypothetical protein
MHKRAVMRATKIGGPYKLVKLVCRHAWETKLTFGMYAERGKYRTSYFAKVTLYGLHIRAFNEDGPPPGA